MRSAVIIRGIAIVAARHVRAGADTAQPLGDGYNLWPPGTWLAKPTELQHFKTYDWQVDATRPLVALGDGFSLVSLSHPGDSAALVLIHAERGGVGIVGDWGDDFGGLGVQLAIEAECRGAHTERVLVRVTETNRGYWLDPGQGDCPKTLHPMTTAATCWRSRTRATSCSVSNQRACGSSPTSQTRLSSCAASNRLQPVDNSTTGRPRSRAWALDSEWSTSSHCRARHASCRPSTTVIRRE
jgi:hypothetical protein